MSRSVRGSKGPGYDYWSRRPSKGTTPSKENKTKTVRLERKIAKKELDLLDKDL
jgi:hypothetical protein